MSLVLGIPVVVDYFETRLVLRLPTAVLAGLAIISLVTGATNFAIGSGVQTGLMINQR